jgi:hypothetical protein
MDWPTGRGGLRRDRVLKAIVSTQQQNRMTKELTRSLVSGKLVIFDKFWPEDDVHRFVWPTRLQGGSGLSKGACFVSSTCVGQIFAEQKRFSGRKN